LGTKIDRVFRNLGEKMDKTLESPLPTCQDSLMSWVGGFFMKTLEGLMGKDWALSEKKNRLLYSCSTRVT
jgi:hypothetical protein